MKDFLRRLIGSGRAEPGAGSSASRATETRTTRSPADVEADERAYERELLRGEAERLDELRQRQLRYAEHAWRPPAQGGERRADDDDPASEEPGR
jgi:hypothetical protein